MTFGISTAAFLLFASTTSAGATTEAWEPTAMQGIVLLHASFSSDAPGVAGREEDGSGLVVGVSADSAVVVTARHVVAEVDGRPARVIRTDFAGRKLELQQPQLQIDNKLDIAFVRVDLPEAVARMLTARFRVASEDAVRTMSCGGGRCRGRVTILGRGTDGQRQRLVLEDGLERWTATTLLLNASPLGGPAAGTGLP
jgi:hypothetical protein